MANLTLFSRIISKLDRLNFNKIVTTHQSDKHQKGYNSGTQLVSMLFCQFARSQSVRDLSNGLRSATGNLLLCLSLFGWAKYKTAKGAIKMQALLDFDGNLPAYVNLTDGKTADNKGPAIFHS